MKTFRIEFAGKINPIIVEFKLEDNLVAEAWAQQIQHSKVIHAGSADSPTEIRVNLLWQALREAIAIVNDEHITDEWIHIPQNFSSDNWQSFCNNIRLKAQIYEIYAKYHNMTTQTRKAFIDLTNIITSLENTANTTDAVRGVWFKWDDHFSVPPDNRSNKFADGSIVAVHPSDIRTINDARRANDKTVVQRNLLKDWSMTNRAFFALANFEENTEKNNNWLVDNNLTEKVTNYTSTYFSLATLITPLSDSEKVELLRSKLERIVFK